MINGELGNNNIRGISPQGFRGAYPPQFGHSPPHYGQQHGIPSYGGQFQNMRQPFGYHMPGTPFIGRNPYQQPHFYQHGNPYSRPPYNMYQSSLSNMHSSHMSNFDTTMQE